MRSRSTSDFCGQDRIAGSIQPASEFVGQDGTQSKWSKADRIPAIHVRRAGGQFRRQIAAKSCFPSHWQLRNAQHRRYVPSVASDRISRIPSCRIRVPHCWGLLAHERELHTGLAKPRPEAIARDAVRQCRWRVQSGKKRDMPRERLL
jgi:hypothetical protein